MNSCVLKNIAQLKTPLGNAPIKGKQMSNLLTLNNVNVVATDGVIDYVGNDLPKYINNEYQIIDCSECAVVPAFCDSHTHLVFGGYRADEFLWRSQGLSYMEIMNRGGGIANSVNATRQASEQQLYSLARSRLADLATQGITSVEIKSGYGLDIQTELKQLRVINQLKKDGLLDIASTFMGAHSIPKAEFSSSSEYIDFINNSVLDKVVGLAEFVDVFCEKNVFSVKDSEKLFLRARELGFKLKIHADEIVCTFGAELACRMGCVSADHLLQVSEQGIKDLANSNTIATLLPLTAFSLKEPYANARKIIDSGGAVALATDFNPGSCFSYSIPLLIAIAVIYMNMTIDEVICALTLNGACAMGMQSKVGTIEKGKQADLLVLRYNDVSFLPYNTGVNNVKYTIKKGKII